MCGSCLQQAWSPCLYFCTELSISLGFGEEQRWSTNVLQQRDISKQNARICSKTWLSMTFSHFSPTLSKQLVISSLLHIQITICRCLGFRSECYHSCQKFRSLSLRPVTFCQSLLYSEGTQACLLPSHLSHFVPGWSQMLRGCSFWGDRNSIPRELRSLCVWWESPFHEDCLR